MKHRHVAGRDSRFKSVALSVLLLASGVLVVVALVAIGNRYGHTVLLGGALFAVVLLFNAAGRASDLLPQRQRQEERRAHRARKRSEQQLQPLDETPPVNEEFERDGDAFFISATPRFMPRWLVHADLNSVVVNSPIWLILIPLSRGAVRLVAAAATWCLRRPWTVTVERRNSADGSYGWRFVLLEEYRSFARAYRRRDEIVQTWNAMDYATRRVIG
jgi:hypothetical protein